MSAKKVWYGLLTELHNRFYPKQRNKTFKKLNGQRYSRRDFDTSRYYTANNNGEGKVKKDLAELKKESEQRIKELEEELKQVSSSKPYVDMTMGEFSIARPDVPLLINRHNRPSFWPHTEDEQSLETPVIHIPDDDAMAEQQTTELAQGAAPTTSDSLNKELPNEGNNIAAASEAMPQQIPENVQVGTVPPQLEPAKTTPVLHKEGDKFTVISETNSQQQSENVQSGVVPPKYDSSKVVPELPKDGDNVIAASETKPLLKPEYEQKSVIPTQLDPPAPTINKKHGSECDCPKCTAKRKLKLLKDGQQTAQTLNTAIPKDKTDSKEVPILENVKSNHAKTTSEEPATKLSSVKEDENDKNKNKSDENKIKEDHTTNKPDDNDSNKPI